MENTEIHGASESAMNELARSLLRAVALYFDDPEHMAAFEEWKRAREAQKKEREV